MAIETLAAIGLAGNIVQFVDFLGKTYESAKEIHNSASGASQKTKNLLLITADLKDICEKLRGHGLGPADSMSGLALECHKAGTEVLTALEKLTNQKPGSKWASFRVALLAVWKQGKIDQMGMDLDRLRAQLILRLQEFQLGDNSQMLSRLEAVQQSNDRTNAKLDTQTTHITVTVLDAIKKLELEIRRQQQVYMTNVITKTKATDKPEASPEIPTLTASLVPSLLLTSTTHLELLRSLCFENMTYRYGRVVESYPKTFDWMFSNNFMDWLQSNSSLFWISGKPGSGKSTLMKYLVQQDRTMNVLQTWAGNQQLVVCSYFFWSNGTKMQRSDEGLLRSLFYDILRQCPYLIKDSFPIQWASILAGHREAVSWDRSELLRGFQRLVQHNQKQARICIFIDGLDEYDGDCDELIDIVRALGDTEDVKLCVASRPWNVFETAFGGLHNQKRKLYLQDLNKSDIEKYVRGKIGTRPEFCALKAHEPGADELMQEITTKSQGVFLWVHLVVRSLIQGLQNADRIVDLQRRLRAFPSDLNEFFSNIFHSLDEIYRVQVARSFQAALSASRPLSLLNYHYLDVEEIDPSFVESMPTQSLSIVDLTRVLDQMKTRLNGRCKGLLEVTADLKESDPAFRFRVDFLHRTVKDFLLTRDMDSLLKNWNEDFEPHLTLARTTLAEIKSVPVSKHSHENSQNQFSRLLDEFFQNVKEHERRHKTSPEKLVDEMQKTLLNLFPAYAKWDTPFENLVGIGFFKLALSWDLHEYAKIKCRQGLVGNSSTEKRLILGHILNPELKPTTGAQGIKGIIQQCRAYDDDYDSTSPSSSTSSLGISEELPERQTQVSLKSFWVPEPSYKSSPDISTSFPGLNKNLLSLRNQPSTLPDSELIRLILEHGPAVKLKRADFKTLLAISSEQYDKDAATIRELLLHAGAIQPEDIMKAPESYAAKPRQRRIGRPSLVGDGTVLKGQSLPTTPRSTGFTKNATNPRPKETVGSTEQKHRRWKGLFCFC